eukprot:gnl/MRDRNA2_/MRDRNA2_357752_c0_seq1.p1 gnl/MRDRNA2_/MRDRNA2_357752_c0~~gnl/MRDRNA2_/MRDRNA2_357752_c0_seq1.p1  ORF type:complete len:256 (+),score=54.48 gnl/MRDRNA2_/MRDRNA2_357752_c0_seq1:115-768(+)
MAGTAMQEGHRMCHLLREAMEAEGLHVSHEEIAGWHGSKMEEVIRHFAQQTGIPEQDIEMQICQISRRLDKAIDEMSFDSNVNSERQRYFKQLRAAGIKVALDTGYPKSVQQSLMRRLGFDSIVDGWISSGEVKEGRPHSSMVHRLMDDLGIKNVKKVAKVGNSIKHVEQGINAGCSLVVGVLNGAASTQQDFLNAGAHYVYNNVTDLPIPHRLVVR